ncbi:hypothetical protein MRB53_008718 [Persea americana]|uniref:Uncharacterized protein n=1 Tax=Persea americana TaxID=3435 RepID=A0ACC2MNJ3_PERAE|nr:hypothetical protein MRB53_008718 [Persea americana]
MVAYHLLVKGFMNNYEDCWWAHGQRRDSGITQVHNPGSSTHRMNDMVHDIARPNFDWEQDREQVMNYDAKAFFKLLDEGSEPLWPGCTKQTTLSTVATLLNIKADHNMSHECFESLLKAIKSMLPDGEKLPDNYYFCKKMVKKLGLGYQKIDASPNDCKTKDNDKALLDMKDICKRPGLELYETPNDGYASNIARCVTSGKLQGMNSHDCHVFMERLMPLAFRDLLDKPIWDALTDLSRFFRDICSKTLNEKDMSILEKNIIEITYYFPDEVLTKANRVPRHDDGGNVELNGRLSVFGLPGHAYGKGKCIFLYEQELHAAHTYILFNCEEIDDFVRSYDDELKANQSSITDKDIQLNRDQNFALWPKDKALNDVSIPSNVQVLTMGPDRDQVCRNGYKVNGYDFHTKTYASGKRTTNTRVCIQGDCYNELGHAFYGELEEIIELSYKGTYGGQINLFKCHWFDSEKGIRVDRHGITDIDVHRSTYVNAPFVLPTQTLQVYYTPSPIRKRDRQPTDWQVGIRTPARTRVQLVDREFYQEEMLHRPPVINVDDNNELNRLVGGDEPDELDPKSLPVLVDSDTEEEELLTETDTDTESKEDDGYESPHDVQDDSESDNDVFFISAKKARLGLGTGLRQQLRGASTPLGHKDAVRVEFQKRYRWDDAHASIIQTIFWQKCAARTKDNLSKERQKALQNAQIDHPRQAEEYMHEYSPWWCAPTIWAGMCEQWKAESWVKRRRTAAVNRASGAPEGNKAPGTYKGSSISQLQHVAASEASSQGQPIHWLDVYVATCDGLPEAVQIVETYNTLMDECYPEGTSRPPIDQELWERASVVKKNYVKGQGRRRRPTISGTGSSGSQSTQSSYQPMPHTAADCVRAICRDRDLLHTLRVHLQSLDPDELADAVVTAAQQETDDEARLDDNA